VASPSRSTTSRVPAGSLVDVRPVRDTAYLEGKSLEFKVIKLDQKRNNVVVSRRAVVEQEFSAERSALMDNLQEGTVLKGTVKNLTDYGAFVDLGGIDGLLHITDMAWKRVKHPSEVVKVGDEIDVRILKFDRERSRVSLGLKQLGADPWENIARRYPPNTRVFGKVTNIADYGAFVEIEDGVEGLVHVSEMDWTNKNVNPAKVVHSGQEVEVMVLDVDEERRRISLGLKQCKQNPWKEFAENFNRGDKVSGQIKSITDFGVFIGLAGNIDGLVHLSISPGTWPAKKPCATTRRASSSRRWCCRSIRSVSASRSASSSSRRIRSASTSRRTEGHDRQGRGQGSGRAWRGHRPRQRHRRPAACLRARARSRRRRAHRAQVGPGSRSPLHRRDRKTRTIALSIKAKESTKSRRRCRTTAPTSLRRAPAWATCSRSRLAAIVNQPLVSTKAIR
jgi:small subunit ribosomal protein S1